MITLQNIWIYEVQDGITGGIIIAKSEEEAWKRLSIDRNSTVEETKSFSLIYPLSCYDLGKKIIDLW